MSAVGAPRTADAGGASGSTDLLIATAVGIVALSLYVATVAPSITWRFSGADSGDLAAAVATWGIPHPTGYPLYVALGGLFSHLVAIGSPAYRLNLFSAAASALAAWFVCLTVLRLAYRVRGAEVRVARVAAVTAALSLAASGTLWSQSVLAEVYALEVLFAAVIAYLLTFLPLSSGRLTLLCALCGPGLTHHTTIVFSIAAAVVAVLTAQGRPLCRNPRLLAVYSLAFAAPLALYLLLPIRAAQHPASNWGDPTTFGRFVDVVTGAPYHGYLDLNPLDALTTLPAVLRLALGQAAWWLAPLAFLGVMVLWGVARSYSLYLLVLLALPQLFVAAYHAQGREAYALQSYMGLSIAVGLGLVAAAAWVRTVWTAISSSRLVQLALVVGAATVVPWAIVGLHDFNLRGDRAALNYAYQALSSAAPGATLFVDTDEQTFPLWYAQRAEHLRPDVHVVAVRFRDQQHQR